ncbi:MAG: stage II sporulation protein M [Acidimicrobiales bacterium]
MDIDRYIARNQASWDRLDDLTGRARRRVGNLTPDELDELVSLYQRVSTQLSYVRTYYRDTALVARLTRSVAAANGVVYGKRARTWRALGGFFAATFPGAVYHYRRFVLVAALLFFVPALLLYVWLVNDPTALDASGSRAERSYYVDNLFEQYYSESPSPQFFTEVTTNNIRVTFLVFAAGIVVPIVGPAFLLLANGAPLGIIGSWMATEDSGWRFLGFILPHGMLELSAICIAGGGGLALGWSLVAPGDRRRGEALREEGRRLVVIFLGLVVMLVAAGFIEGFITGRGLPVALRIAIGVAGWLAFVAYFVAQGRAAAAKGITGAWREHEQRRRWQDFAPDEDLPPSAVVVGD